MLLYSLTEKGYLRRIKSVNFLETATYIIDDENTLYLWLGSKISDNKKLNSKERVEKLNSERNNIATIQILNQNKEYGRFLSIMDILRKGVIHSTSTEKRNELIIEFEDTMELIEAGLEPDLEAKITVAAHNLSQKTITYEELCKKLAELQLKIVKENEMISQTELEKKTQEIFQSSSTYEEICWLIAELEILIEENF